MSGRKRNIREYGREASARNLFLHLEDNFMAQNGWSDSILKHWTLFEYLLLPGESLAGKLQLILVDFCLQDGSGSLSHIPEPCAKQWWGGQPVFQPWLVGAKMGN